jgi:hypothetical protein
MNFKSLGSVVTFLSPIILLLLAAIPWIFQESNRPLMPPEFAITATQYVFIEQTFQYQRDIERMQATSIVVFDTPIPLHTEVPPTPDNDESSRVSRLFRFPSWQANYSPAQAADEQLRAYSPYPLSLYYCPSPDALMNRTLEPYTEFATLGYSENHLGDLYFLIQNDLIHGQQWIRVSDSLIFWGNADYRQVFSTQSSCRVRLDVAIVDQLAPTPTATIELPRALTATPELVSSVLVITDEYAARLLGDFNEEFQNVEVAIREQGMTITGDTFISIPILGRRAVPFEIMGVLEIHEQKLRMNVQTLVVNGIDRSGSEESERVEYLINNWLLSLMYRRLVQAIDLSEGSLTVSVLQHPTLVTNTPVHPTPTSTFSPTVLTPTLPRALTATPRATSTAAGNMNNQFGLSDLAASFRLKGLSLGWLNLSIHFHSDSRVSVLASIPVESFLGRTLFAEVSVTGRLRVNRGRLEMESESVRVNGVPLDIGSAEIQVETLVNSWLAEVLSSQFVESFKVESGFLLINPTGR